MGEPPPGLYGFAHVPGATASELEPVRRTLTEFASLHAFRLGAVFVAQRPAEVPTVWRETMWLCRASGVRDVVVPSLKHLHVVKGMAEVFREAMEQEIGGRVWVLDERRVIGLGVLPEVDPERNREVLAERLGWPIGAVEECRAVEAEEPSWNVWWVPGGLPSQPEPGFTAHRGDDACSEQQDLFAATAGELLREIRQARPYPPRYGYQGPTIYG